MRVRITLVKEMVHAPKPRVASVNGNPIRCGTAPDWSLASANASFGPHVFLLDVYSCVKESLPL